MRSALAAPHEVVGALTRARRGVLTLEVHPLVRGASVRAGGEAAPSPNPGPWRVRSGCEWRLWRRGRALEAGAPGASGTAEPHQSWRLAGVALRSAAGALRDWARGVAVNRTVEVVYCSDIEEPHGFEGRNVSAGDPDVGLFLRGSLQ